MVRQPWRNFSNSRIMCANMGHVSPTSPTLGVICHPYARTCYDQRLSKWCHTLWVKCCRSSCEFVIQWRLPM